MILDNFIINFRTHDADIFKKKMYRFFIVVSDHSKIGPEK